MTIQSGEILGNYQIEKHLSKKGATSQIFLAKNNERPELHAALKVHLTNDNRYQDLLRKEADVLSRLHHPGVVRIYPQYINGRVVYEARADLHRDQPWYFVMEHITGPSLDQLIDKQIIKKYPIAWIIELFYQLLTIVNFLHKAGYAHCDLKPSNILLRYPPSATQIPYPVLVDFGSVTSIKSSPANLAGTILYLPPEAIMLVVRSDITPKELSLRPDKVDIWSLGAIFFEMLTGRPLINHKSKEQATTSILQGQLDSLKSERPDINPSLDILLRNMISKEAEKRPPVHQLIAALEEDIAEFRPPRIPINS